MVMKKVAVQAKDADINPVATLANPGGPSTKVSPKKEMAVEIDAMAKMMATIYPQICRSTTVSGFSHGIVGGCGYCGGY